MNKSNNNNNNNINNNNININQNLNKFNKNNNFINFIPKRKSSSFNNISLDQFQFESKAKKGNKFELLEFKRLNEIQNFDICNCKKKIII
jgi:hypothetical protein